MAQVEVTNIQGYAAVTPAKQVEVTNVQGYAAVTPPNGLGLRNVISYVMAQSPAQLGLRNFVGYAMALIPPPLPTGVTGRQAVLNMIAKRSKATRPASDFTIDPAQPLANDLLYNSTVKAYATAASGLLGNMTFRYNRVPLERLGLSSTNFDLGTFTTIYEMLPTIKTLTGVELTSDDIEDGPVTMADAFVTLRAKSTSWWFLPGSTLAIGKSLPSINVPISSDTIDW